MYKTNRACLVVEKLATNASRIKNVSTIVNPSTVLEKSSSQNVVEVNPKRSVKIPTKGLQDNTAEKALSKDGTSYHEKIILGYSREQMCNLVFDVARYKEFVPFCVDSKIMNEVPRPGKLNLTKLSRNNMSLNLKNIDSSLSNKQLHLPRHFRAKLEIGYPPIQESYISNVTSVHPTNVKSVSRDTNLFEYLINEWKFHPNPQSYELEHLNSLSEVELKDLERSCLVEFYVSFKFVNVFYSTFSSMFMDQIFTKMVSAFTARAKVLYGKPAVMPKIVNNKKNSK